MCIWSSNPRIRRQMDLKCSLVSQPNRNGKLQLQKPILFQRNNIESSKGRNRMFSSGLCLQHSTWMCFSVHTCAHMRACTHGHTHSLYITSWVDLWFSNFNSHTKNRHKWSLSGINIISFLVDSLNVRTLSAPQFELSTQCLSSRSLLTYDKND